MALTGADAERFDARVLEYAEDAFALLERLVAADSTLGNEQAAQEIVAAALLELGFDVTEVAIPESIGEHSLAGIPQLSYDGRRDIVGRWQGSEPTLLFNGHIDVVPVDAATWSSDPFRPHRKDGWLIGRGAGDMKGGFSMVLLALRALAASAPSSLDVPLGFVSVIEEECTGNGTLASLLAGVHGGAVVLPEPSDLGALLAGVGVVWVDIELSGTGGHAHVADQVPTPVGAISAVIESLDALGKSWSVEVDDPDLVGVTQAYTTNVGTISCGNWRSSVAASARLGVRVGFPRGWDADEALARVEGAVRARLEAESAGGLGLTITGTGFRAEGYHLDATHELVELVADCHEAAHGEPLRRFGLGSTTDARYYLNQLGVPALCYGPVAANIHGADERVELASIVEGARTIGRLVARAGEMVDFADAAHQLSSGAQL